MTIEFLPSVKFSSSIFILAWPTVQPSQPSASNEGTRNGKHTKNYGKSPFLMGKLTVLMAIFNNANTGLVS